MAGLSYHGNRWIVSFGSAPERTFRRFVTKDDALAFMEANGLTHRKRGSIGRGRRSLRDVIDHLAANFDIDHDTGCWNWTGSLHTAGYAGMTWKPDPDGRMIPGGHRVVLHAVVDPIPDGLVVDHLCRNRKCINPDHLDTVVQRENIMRSPIAPGALNAAKTHCVNGHEYTAENTTTYYGHGGRKTHVRVCRTCQRAWAAKAAAKRKAAVA